MQSIAMPQLATVSSDLPDALVVLGASGDLAKRMIWPSLYHLHRDGLLPAGLRMIGATRGGNSTETFRDFLQQELQRYVTPAHMSDMALYSFLAQVSSVSAEVSEAGALDTTQLQAQLQGSQAALYFLSLPPGLYGPVSNSLAAAGLVNGATRLVIEKPIGHDLVSSQQINAALAKVFDEQQIYRVDHYLGKETVQNLLALRFANSLFEPLWNSGAIDHVQITVAETVGVEGRWSYYDGAGALRDMIQNHMLQLVALVAMEPPSNFDAAAVRNEKTKVLRSLRPISGADVAARTVRGQYAKGNSGGAAVPGYNEEKGAKGGSTTETFVALRAEIENWRWAGVPFYLRTGKRLQSRRSDIVIQFKNVPHNIFSEHHLTLPANRLIIRLQPEERITMELMSKRPGLDGVQLQSVPLDLSLRDAFGTARTRMAYERLLLDAIKGNTTLFVRRDEIEAAWSWIDGIQNGWANGGEPLRSYPAGSWGPTAAIALAERHGHSWYE
jgi:glucose-6-phosphate 1-dehydrogenase